MAAHHRVSNQGNNKHSSNHTVVMQDVVALNLLEEVLATEPDGYQELSINIDTGGLAARRLLDRMIRTGHTRPLNAGAQP